MTDSTSSSRFLSVRDIIRILCSVIVIAFAYSFSEWLFAPNVQKNVKMDVEARDEPDSDAEEYAKVCKRVDAIWDRIENHLAEHSDFEFKLLLEGCEIEDIESMENQFGFHLPYDVRASLLRHNGSRKGTVPCCLFMLFSIDQIKKNYSEDMESLTYLSELSPRYWQFSSGNRWPYHVAIADTGVEWEVVVDCNSGKVYLCSGDSTLITENWEQVLSRWAIALEAGNYKLQDDGSIFMDDWAGLNPW